MEELEALEEEANANNARLKDILEHLTALNAMDFANLDLPETWAVRRIRDVFAFTKKPRGLTVAEGSSVPFLPMDAIPIGRVHISAR